MICQTGAVKIPAPFKVIINRANPTDSITSRLLAEIFLKQEDRWHGFDDSLIRPVDLLWDSAIRSAFSRQILGRSTSAIRVYWHQMIFSGRGIPPPELENDADVIDYVQHHLTAVGYVSDKADTHTVKILHVE